MPGSESSIDLLPIAKDLRAWIKSITWHKEVVANS